ncbi:MAG TPA: chloride channel protein, partial [Trinickia sp.]|nr:chloride channel protein [Trinickia sp.]
MPNRFPIRNAMPIAPITQAKTLRDRSPLGALVAVTLLTGVGAGIGGMLLALLLHWIQHVAYGFSVGHVISSESFLQGVSAAAPERRLMALTACGVVAGAGWWALYRFGGPLVSIKKAVKA